MTPRRHTRGRQCRPRPAFAVALIALGATTAAAAAGGSSRFICAGSPAAAARPAISLAKPLAYCIEGTRQAVAVFATFADDATSSTTPPSWSGDLFDPNLPGSFSHFYDTMSFGKLQVRGEVASRVYAAPHPASQYVSADRTQKGRYGAFCHEILEQADRDIDFSQYDSDGPDGIPNSGDDDGVVDAVFVVVDRAPTGFLLGSATGIGRLGLDGDYETDDPGPGGSPILVSDRKGSIQQGRTFAEAAGAMCHEYGHVLGLPDLYNTAYLRQADPLPEEDSAGIGAWGVMGRGARGWNGDDGPNSFCAWSRARLGWAQVTTLSQAPQDISLPPVGLGGSVLQVPLGRGEYFLLEYRTRQGCYYDRAIPGEGLLIWHARLRPGDLVESEAADLRGWNVDLECADGRWRDRGYPLGQEPAPLDGEDNLDFWAHDEQYRAAHAGNLGDRTDPFDGVAYSAFGPDTNPSAATADGATPVRIDSIRRGETALTFTVTARVHTLELRNLALEDEIDDGVILSGEPVRVTYRLVNDGGLPAEEVRVTLSSDDPLVQIETPEADHGTLYIGEVSPGSFGHGFPFPAFRVGTGFVGTHEALLVLSVGLAGGPAFEREIRLTAVSPGQQVAAVTVVDTLGNGDGRLQVGELFSLKLTLAGSNPSLLSRYLYRLTPLDPRVRVLEGTAVSFEWAADRMVSQFSPTFLVPADAAVGEAVRLVFDMPGYFVDWSDTLTLTIAPGPDPSAPVVRLVGAVPVPGGCRIMVPEREVFEGEALRSAVAHILDPVDSTLIEAVDLDWRNGGLEGTWLNDTPGQYLVQAILVDRSGNKGSSPVLPVHVWSPLDGRATSGPPAAPQLEPLVLSSRPVPFRRLLCHPRFPDYVFGVSQQALWQTLDGGRTWSNLGIMLHDDAEVFLDPSDPATLYVAPRASYSAVLRTRDGGRTWQHLERPLPLFRLLGADPQRPGRLYGGSGTDWGWGSPGESSFLMASDDYGDSWYVMQEHHAGFVTAAPGYPGAIYATYQAPGLWAWNSELRRSTDDGVTWETRRLPAQEITGLYVDPHSPVGLYATTHQVLYHSSNRGDTWEALNRPPVWSRDSGLAPSPSQPGLLYAWDPRLGDHFFSPDGGTTWQRLALPDSVRGGVFYPHPRNPMEGYCLFSYLLAGVGRAGLLHTDDLETWRRVPAPEMELPTGGFAADSRGRLYLGSGSWDPGLRSQPQVLRADGAGGWTSLAPCPRYSIEPWFVPVVETLLATGDDPGVLIAESRLNPDNSGWMTVTRSADGGATWDDTDLGNYVEGDAYAVIAEHPHDPATMYFSQDRTGLWRSRDAGKSWVSLMTGFDNSGYYGCQPFGNRYGSFSAFAVDGVVADVLYAAGPEFSIFCGHPLNDWLRISRDSGTTWQDAGPVPGGTSIQYLACHPLGRNFLYALTPTALYVSLDRAQTWSFLSPVAGPGELRARRRLRFHPSDSYRMFAVTGPRLLTTADGGLTWHSIGEGIASAPWFEDVAADPLRPDVVYTSTPWGAYRLDLSEARTAVAPDASRPGRTTLEQNYPNPFNPVSAIAYELAEPGLVSLAIYNALGQRVRVLVRRDQSPGSYAAHWDGRSDAGAALASGVYFYRLVVDGRPQQTRRMLLLR